MQYKTTAVWHRLVPLWLLDALSMSTRAAALRVELLRKEHELKRRSDEASRALELHRACSELEMASLEEANAKVQPRECHRSSIQLESQKAHEMSNPSVQRSGQDVEPNDHNNQPATEHGRSRF